MLVTVGPVVAGPRAHGVRSLKKLGCGVQSRGLTIKALCVFPCEPSAPSLDCFAAAQSSRLVAGELRSSQNDVASTGRTGQPGKALLVPDNQGEHCRWWTALARMWW